MKRKDLLRWTCDEIGVFLGDDLPERFRAELAKFEGVPIGDANGIDVAAVCAAIVAMDRKAHHNH